jgi:hypothetical protein
MDDAGLMEKYRLTPVGLQRLYRELAGLGLLQTEKSQETSLPVTTVKIREFVKDVRSGMTDAGLVEKYGISSEALHSIFRKLLDLKALTHDDLFGHEDLRTPSVLHAQKRAMDRYVLDFELGMFDAHAPDNRGIVRDINEEGVGVTGMDATAGDTRTLLVSPDDFLEIQPFIFKAECRWSDAQGPGGARCAGFKIVHISDENLAALRELIRLLSF